MIEILTLLGSYLINNQKVTVSLILLIIYLIYYKKYGFYIFRQKKNYTRGKHRIGKTLPAYPNGWFVILRSHEIAVGETQYVDAHGESLAVFRGNNGKVYVVGAFCPHLGANLGIEGRVIHDSCIQCPFHAWTFDGETGNCVTGRDLKPKEGIKYEYEFNKENKTCEFKATKTERVKIKKYLTKEHSGYIYVWFDAKDKEFRDFETVMPAYEPLDLTDVQKRLYHRGYSLNIINAHLSDIHENGGDILHFLYIHTEIIPFLVKGYWDAAWIRGDDPKLREKLRLPNKEHNAFRTKLLDKYLNENSKKHIGVIHLSNAVKVLNLPFNINFFTLTGFQVGPGLVYLFIKGSFFETMLLQHVRTKEKYNQEVYHEIYTNYLAPYWFSALQLRLEARQVLNDGVVWDNKKFGYQAYFNKNSNEADDFLITWRQWFTQFYEGCQEEEEKKHTLDW